MENPLLHDLFLESNPLGFVWAWSNHWSTSLWENLPQKWSRGTLVCLSCPSSPRQVGLWPAAHPGSDIRKVGLGGMVGCTIWWHGNTQKKAPIFDYILFTVFLSCRFILGSQSINAMTTYYLQMVEKVQLLEDKLKGNHWPPHSPLDLLRGWEIGLWLWVCLSVWECVHVCVSVRACLFVSILVYEKVCVSVYIYKCMCLRGCVSVYSACVVWVTYGYECVWLHVCVWACVCLHVWGHSVLRRNPLPLPPTVFLTQWPAMAAPYNSNFLTTTITPNSIIQINLCSMYKWHTFDCYFHHVCSLQAPLVEMCWSCFWFVISY